MTKFLLLTVTALFLSACTTMQDIKSEHITSEGVRYKYGSSDGIKPGDKINAYKKIRSTSRRGFSYTHAGTLTVVKAEENYSILKKDQDFEIDKSISLKND